MKRKKFLALALAGVMTAATLTACAPLEDLPIRSYGCVGIW